MNVFFSFNLYSLPHLYTYIDSTVVEQRQVYTAEEIAESHCENLVSFCENAGIQILSYGAYGLEAKPSIRGFTDETVRVVIDGICVNNAQYGTFDFSTLNLNNIERIEILRGGFSEGVSDEGAVGGAIYITTKKQSLGHSFYGDTALKTFLNPVSPLDTIFQTLGYSGQLSENTFLKVDGKFASAQNKYQFVNNEEKIKTRENSEVMDGNGNVSLSHFFSSGSSWTVSESFYGGNKNCPGYENGYGSGKQQDYDNRLTFNLVQPEIAQGIRLENNFSWQSGNRFYSDKSGESRHFVNTWTYAGYCAFYKSTFYRQTAGLTLDAVHLNSTDDGIHFQFSGTLKETSKFQFNQIFSMSVPMAVKFCGSNFEFVPKLGVKAETKYADFLLNGYRMVQFPNMDDLYWDSNGFHGNPDLKAENGWGAEFTLNLHDFYVPLSACVFTNYYENKIQWANTNGTWQPENIASAFYLGVNLSLEKTLFNGILEIRGNSEYLYTALMDKSNEKTYKNQIMWTPDWVFAVSGKLNLRAVSLMVSGNYTGKRYTSNMNNEWLDPYFLLHLTMELRTFSHVTPYLKLENLLDTSYVSVKNYPMPGRSLTVGVKANW